jgi:CubicO group peptidase (beta-lactamase class C family)
VRKFFAVNIKRLPLPKHGKLRPEWKVGCWKKNAMPALAGRCLRALFTAMLLPAFVWAAGEPSQPTEVPASMRKFMEWGDISGAVTLVAKAGKIVEFDALGYADLSNKRPMQKDTLFWVASMTKPITSVAVLMLSDEEKLSLDDPVEKHLPAFNGLWLIAEKSDDRMVLMRPSRPPTIRDLLTHMHGLEEPPIPAAGASLEEVAASVARGPLQFEPGTQWKYGNAGMDILGRIVEVVSGQSFPDFLETRFFTPLGMKNTTFYPDAEQLKKLAKSYDRPPEWGPLREVGIWLLNGDLAKKEQTVLPGAGLFSTAEDIFHFYQMLLNGGEYEGRRYLRKETVSEMLTPQTGDLEAGFSPGMAWGLGVGIVRNPQGWTDVLPAGTWGHDGAYGTTVMAEPERKLLFIMMIQRGGLFPSRDGLKFRHAFHSAVMRDFAK